MKAVFLIKRDNLTTMKKIKIDFVSDVACPWCAVGLGALTKALNNLKGEVDAELHFQPFELNPQMPIGGQDTVEHLTEKYGMPAEQIQRSQEQIRERAAAVDFPFSENIRPRIYNTFNCHRLLHWADVELGAKAQADLKKELLISNFRLGDVLDDPKALLGAVERAGLDVKRATQVLESNEFADEVRQVQVHYRDLGITAVPSIIFNNKHLLQGGQPVEMFEQAIRQISQTEDPV